MIHRGQMNPSSSSSCCSSSSSSCFSEKHDRPHLYYRITLWASIKKKGLLCLLGLAGMTNALRIVSLGKQAHTHMYADVHIPAAFNSHMFSVQGALYWEYCGPPWAVRSCPEGELHIFSLTFKINVL